MSTYHYSACHDCKLVGMLPKTSNPEYFHSEWVNQHGHKEHNTQFASEYDEEFEAIINGREVMGHGHYGIITKKVSEPYKDVTKETL